MSKRSAMHLCTSTIEWKDKASNMLCSIGNRHNMPHDQVYTVLLYDMNTPYARSKKGLKAAASLASKMASDNKSRCVVVCLLTDIAVKGAKVGVQDDDDNLIKEFSAEGINVDVRFAVWSERQTASEEDTIDSVLPGCHFGRLGVKADANMGKTNKFLSKSKLGKKRRPDVVAMLPPFKDLLHCESLSVHADVMSRDRKTTSVEQLAAQKGVNFQHILLKSCIDGLGLGCEDAVCFIDLTPHLGCGAVAAYSLQQELVVSNCYYISMYNDAKEHAYANARVQGMLAQKWLQEELKDAHHKPQRSPPPLPKDRIEQVPGGRAAMGDLESLQLQVCRVIDGKLEVLDQHTTCFQSGPHAYLKEVDAILKKHNEKYLNILQGIGGSPTAAKSHSDSKATEDGSEEDQKLLEFDSEAAAAATCGGIVRKCCSPLQHISILKGKDGGAFFLMSSKDTTLCENWQVGGVGGGSFEVSTGKEDFAIPYTFDQGVAA